jgi:DNA-binding IclR family transcriptional regulator
MRSSVKSELELEVMKALFLAWYFKRREWFRFNQISDISGVEKPTLQRILPRLEKRGWIESWTGETFDPNEPAMAVIHLDYYDSDPAVVAAVRLGHRDKSRRGRG